MAHFSTEQSERYLLLGSSPQSLDTVEQLEESSNNPCIESDDEEVLLRCQKIRRCKRSTVEKLYKFCNMRRYYAKCLLIIVFVSLVLFLGWKMSLFRDDFTNDEAQRESAEWFANSSRHAYNYIRPKNFTTLLEPHDVCRNNTFLMIVVYSNIDSFAERQNIRNTWGNTTDFNYSKFSKMHSDFKGMYLDPPIKRLHDYEYYINGNEHNNGSNESNITASSSSIIPVRVVFFMGRRSRESFVNTEAMRHLRSESNKYNDIILENFIDNYKNVTIKSVMMLKWLMSRCLGSCAFIMKCHDDVFVNVPNLLQFLLGGTIPLYTETLEMYDKSISSSQMLNNTQRFKMKSNVLIGHLIEGNQTISDAINKSNMPFHPFPVSTTYPPYLDGSSYLMSNDVVSMLFSTALWAPLIYAEDIFITGVCIKYWHLVSAQHNPLFGIKYNHTPCSVKGSITQHPINSDDLLKYYKLVNDNGMKCAAPNY